MPIIYEVNLRIQSQHADRFAVWLKPHIEEMCSFEGFIKADWYHNHEASSDKEVVWSIMYTLQDISFYQRYCAEQAPRMRQEGLDLFSGVFTASRRILHLYDGCSKQGPQ